MCTQSGPNNLNNNNPRQNTTDESHGRRSRRFRNKTALRNDSITDKQMELQAAVLHYCSRRRNNKTGRWSISTFSSLSLVSLIHFVRHNGEQLIGQISGTAAGRNCRFDVTQIELKTCSSAPPAAVTRHQPRSKQFSPVVKCRSGSASDTGCSCGIDKQGQRRRINAIHSSAPMHCVSIEICSPGPARPTGSQRH